MNDESKRWSTDLISYIARLKMKQNIVNCGMRSEKDSQHSEQTLKGRLFDDKLAETCSRRFTMGLNGSRPVFVLAFAWVKRIFQERN